MRKYIFAASTAAIALVATPAVAQTRSQATCEQQSTTQVVATVAGAGVGGVIGNAVAGRGDKTLGTVIGAAAGALAGNQLARPSRDCSHAYGYYDQDARWHATGVSSVDARGYYDREGAWVEGPPAGRYGTDNRWISNGGSRDNYGAYRPSGEWVPAMAEGYYDRDGQWVGLSGTGAYDRVNATPLQPARRADAYGYYDVQGEWHASVVAQGRATGYYDRDNRWVAGAPNGYYDERRNWVPTRADGSASGSYDRQNRWIPASSNGYFDDRGQWVAGAASGHYDSRGRWVAGVAVGRYDERGRWVAGDAGGHRDAAGRWIADPQPGYYDTAGRWHAGETVGYYDARGRWMAMGVPTNGNYAAAGRTTILAQLAALDRYVGTARSQGSMSNRQLARLQGDVNAIRLSERTMRHDRVGNLSAYNEAMVQVRINTLNTRLGLSTQ
jgi:hypothetical protein